MPALSSPTSQYVQFFYTGTSDIYIYRPALAHTACSISYKLYNSRISYKLYNNYNKTLFKRVRCIRVIYTTHAWGLFIGLYSRPKGGMCWAGRRLYGRFAGINNACYMYLRKWTLDPSCPSRYLQMELQLTKLYFLAHAADRTCGFIITQYTHTTGFVYTIDRPLYKWACTECILHDLNHLRSILWHNKSSTINPLQRVAIGLVSPGAVIAAPKNEA